MLDDRRVMYFEKPTVSAYYILSNSDELLLRDYIVLAKLLHFHVARVLKFAFVI